MVSELNDHRYGWYLEVGCQGDAVALYTTSFCCSIQTSPDLRITCCYQVPKERMDVFLYPSLADEPASEAAEAQTVGCEILGYSI